MYTVDIQEQRRYTRKELIDKFHTNETETVSIIKKLKELNILKTVKKNDNQLKMTDLLDDDIEIVDEEDYSMDHLYVFTFVGVILVNGLVLKCYPKYLSNIELDEKLEEKMRVILQVLQKYNRKKEELINIYFNGEKNRSFNLLAAIVKLMTDYYEYGIYFNERNIIEENGSGEIDWNRTINDTYPIIRNNEPYYMELMTRHRTVDDNDFFKRLHEIVLTKCSKQVEDAQLMNILGLTEIFLSDEDLLQLGDKDYILNRLKKEKHVQYNTRKIELLSILEAYISHKGTIKEVDNFSVYGTNSFNLVWEETCREVLKNQLDSSIEDLDIPCKDGFKDLEIDLLSYIKKPQWSTSRGTLADETRSVIPDMIAVGKVGDVYEFDIFDAKYYNTLINRDGVSGNPGVESIVKQYVYQMAYEEFVEKSGIKKENVNNCFIMPMDSVQYQIDENTDQIVPKMNPDVKVEGDVEMEIFGRGPIKIRKILAERVFDFYLRGKNMDIEDMKLSK